MGVEFSKLVEQITLEVITCLLVSFISAIFSALFTLFAWQNRMARKLWNLKRPGDCTICVSAHQWTQHLADGGVRVRSSVSKGQIIALPHVISSLHKAYADSFRWEHLYNAYEPQAQTAFAGNDDLILIGGSVTNPVTGGIFDLIRNRVDISYNHKELNVTVPNARPFHYEVERNGLKSDGIYEVTKDYAVIIHATVQGATEKRRVVVLAGCTTLGTGTAGQFFCSRMSGNEQWQAMGNRDYVAILSCPYVNQRPDMENTKVEAFFNI